MAGRPRRLAIPSPSLVVTIGPAGAGKSTFCRRRFLPEQIVSSDACRARVAGDAADQRATPAAFALAHGLAEARLRQGLLTVFDATSVEPRARRALLDLAARHHLAAVALVFDLPLQDCVAQDARRDGRRVGRAVIARQAETLAAFGPALEREGFAAVHRLTRPEEAARARIALVPLPCDRTSEAGPFDVVGDVHGCAAELHALLRRLGYSRSSPGSAYRHPDGRRAVFVGDLVDRGPRIVEAAKVAMAMGAAGSALAVPGNHEVRLLRLLATGDPPPSAGSARSLEQIAALTAAERRRFIRRLRDWVGGLPHHLVLDGGRLAVAHAGLREEHVGRDSEAVRRFALHGETTGEVDRYGLPVRVKWAAAYRGKALVVYGHTPVVEPEWAGNTLNLDTGCVYGGALSALRYPEMIVVSLRARRAWYRSSRPLPARVGLRAETRALPRPRA